MPSIQIKQHFKSFQQIARSMPASNLTQTLFDLNQILNECKHHQKDPLYLRDLIFARAMVTAFQEKEAIDHIYLKEFEIPQIKLFELLLKAYPVVRLTHQVANQHLYGFLRKKKRAILIDVGIGTGHQLSEVLNRLANDPTSRLEHLRLIGVEPSQEALNDAEKLLKTFEKTERLTVEFIPVNSFAEDLEIKDYLSWLTDEPTPLVVNASFVLHHIRTQEQRHKVLKTLRSIQTSALIISEPNVDHFEPNYAKRFENCYQHFSMCFEIIDQLEIADSEKSALKLFFSREIEDILGNEEEHRVEKHQRISDWLELSQFSGFEPRMKFPDLKSANELGIEVNYRDNSHWGISYKGETAIGVIYLEPSKD